MTTLNGLPAHALFVHFIVILAPLTAILAVLCAVWPAARKRLVWLVLGLATAVVVLTPLTTEAGEWLEDQVGRSPLLHQHTELGDTMIYFSIALFVAAVVLDGTRDVDVEAIREFARGILTPYKVPRRIFVVDELPTSLIGKVLRRQVRESLLALTQPDR